MKSFLEMEGHGNALQKYKFGICFVVHLSDHEKKKAKTNQTCSDFPFLK